MREIFSSYLEYFETLTPETVPRLKELVIPDFHFKDPFNDVRDAEHVVEIFHDMFRRLRSAKFVITDTVAGDDHMYVRWDFHLEAAIINRGKPHTIDGISLVRANSDDKITEHIDFWDASSQLYMHIPVVGIGMKVLRKLAA